MSKTTLFDKAKTVGTAIAQTVGIAIAKTVAFMLIFVFGLVTVNIFYSSPAADGVRWIIRAFTQ